MPIQCAFCGEVIPPDKKLCEQCEGIVSERIRELKAELENREIQIMTLQQELADANEKLHQIAEIVRNSQQFRVALRTIANGHGWAARIAQKSLDIASGKFDKKGNSNDDQQQGISNEV